MTNWIETQSGLWIVVTFSSSMNNAIIAWIESLPWSPSLHIFPVENHFEHWLPTISTSPVPVVKDLCDKFVPLDGACEASYCNFKAARILLSAKKFWSIVLNLQLIGKLWVPPKLWYCNSDFSSERAQIIVATFYVNSVSPWSIAQMGKHISFWTSPILHI